VESQHLELTSDETQTSFSSQLHESTESFPSQFNSSSSSDPSYPNTNINEERKAKKPSKPAKFIQMTLDLGQLINKTCQICGMNYRPSNSEDCKLHQKFHSRRGILGFRILTQTLLKSLVEENGVWRGDQDVCIVEVKRGDSNAKRKFAEMALDMVEEELGGVGIPKEELWDLSNGSTGDGRGNGGHRYKVYLYICGNKCVGVCLVQRIKKARSVVPSSVASETVCVPRIEMEQNGRPRKGDGAITICDEDSSAKLGISRIWTSNDSRRQGIARRLLDCAIENFEFAISIPKDKVAFSQPTDSGAKLARAWFGKEDGWLVYTE
jgi:N-acetyltransferase